MNELALVPSDLPLKYDAMCRMVAEVHSVDQVVEIHDKAAAIQEYARQSSNYDLEKQAFEIRKRAERRAGQLLKDMEKAKPGRKPRVRSMGTTDIARLKDLGITKDQSSNWQKLASVPQQVFESAMTEATKGSKVIPLNIKKKRPKTGGEAPRRNYPDIYFCWKDLLSMINQTAPHVFCEVLDEKEKKHLGTRIAEIRDWLNRLEGEIK